MRPAAKAAKSDLPTPGEIKLSCSCPDWADMCKHVAAVLYGVFAASDLMAAGALSVLAGAGRRIGRPAPLLFGRAPASVARQPTRSSCKLRF